MHLNVSEAGPLAVRYGALVELGRVLTGIVRPEDLLEALAARVSRALDSEVFIASRFDAQRDVATVVSVAGAGTGTGATGPTTYAGRECVAIRESRPLLCRADEPTAAGAALGVDPRGRAALVAPILREGRVAGTLTVIGRQGATFADADLDFLAAAASLIAARSEPAAPAGRAQLERLDEIARAIRTISVPDALEHVTRGVAEAAGAPTVTTWLARAGGDLEVAHAVGPGAPRKGTVVPLAQPLFRGLAERRDGVLLPAGALPDDLAAFRPLHGSGPTAILPLAADQRVLGAIAIGWAHDRDSDRADHAAVQRFASLAAVAIAHGRLHEQIHALSLIDPLTGLANRRHLAMFLEKEFAAARRGRRLTILLLDIDGFAEYNRRAGRAAGDAALQACAEIISTHTRAMNLAARYSGDEFVVALADADRRAGFIHASRIAKAMGAHPLIASIQLRMNVGIASFSPRMASLDDLVRAAFTDLDARRKGGGRLTI